MTKAYALQRCNRSRSTLAESDTGVEQPIGHVIDRADPIDQVKLLKDEAKGSGPER